MSNVHRHKDRVLYTNEGRLAPIDPSTVWERVKGRCNGKLTLRDTRLTPLNLMTTLLLYPETYTNIQAHYQLSDEEIADTLVCLGQLAENKIT